MSNKRSPWVLGISASHNGGACLLKGDRIVVAIQEERLSRIKRQRVYAAQPCLAINYCLEYAGIRPSDLSLVVLCAQGRARSPEQDITLNPQLQVSINGVPTVTISHHLGHAVSAFATSGLDESAILVVDGLGSPEEDFQPDEKACVVNRIADGWETISLYHAVGTSVVALEKHLVEPGKWMLSRRSAMPTFKSLGGMYSAVAVQIFGDPLEAGQVMGLAPYGKADFPPDDFFEIVNRQFLFRERVPVQFQHDHRWPECQAQYQDLARSVQEALEAAVLYLADRLRALSSSKNLCYAGGVALNGVTNERLIRESGFDFVYVVPAAEDSGAAVGAAFYGLWQLTKRNTRFKLISDALGREYTKGAIETAINGTPGVTTVKNFHDVLDETAERLSHGQFAGWFQGRSELGPRALSQRSIHADPRMPESKELLNARVKFRAAFRPFAPSILHEEAMNWFEFAGTEPESPFMLRVCRFKSHLRDCVPAVVHVDGTGRVHTVTSESNWKFHALLKRFYEKTNVPILLNTSLNIRGEPIVEQPEDALWCLLYTNLDFCVLGDRIVVKEKGLQSILDLYPRIIATSYSADFALSDDQPQATLTTKAIVLFLVNLPWGEFRQPLPGYMLKILRFIDGKSDGWTLLRKLSDELGAELDQQALLEILGKLRRGSVIAFRSAPS
jgi:carbamoyltransferase